LGTGSGIDEIEGEASAQESVGFSEARRGHGKDNRL
jgi:hypothetical protein